MYERDNAPTAIGGRLRALLIVKGLTINAMAEVAGVPEKHVLAWLEGRLTPSRRPMNRLAGRAGVSLAWIYYGDEHELLPATARRLREAIAEPAKDPAPAPVRWARLPGAIARRR